MKSYTKYFVIFAGLILFWLCNSFSKEYTPDANKVTRYHDASSLDSGLVVYYPFTNGSAADSSGNGIDGTVNGPTPATDRFGAATSAYSFDGIDDYIRIDSLDDMPYKPITYSCWINLNTYTTSVNAQLIIGRDKVYVADEGAILIFNYPDLGWNNELMYFTGGATFQAYHTPPLNQWIHIAFTWDSSDSAKFYVNGVLKNSALFVATSSFYSDFMIGAGGDIRFPFHGKIDDARIYNRALADSEIQSLYHLGGWPWPSTHIEVVDGWNMVSVPVLVADYNISTLFPSAISNAFTYLTSYVVQDTLQNGVGYWMKFQSIDTIPFTGVSIMQDTFNVRQGWNMIGSISSPVHVSTIGSLPGGIVTSDFFDYNGATYVVADTIEPGYSYWVRVNTEGKLILSKSGSTSSSTRIRIVANGELPPPPPELGERTAARTLPTEFGIEQNYPNPFNPITIIKYGLPSPSNVKLRIFNVLGQVVTTLKDEEESAGYKQIEWNSSAVASGIYFYRLEAIGTDDLSKRFIQVKKMILVK